MENKGYLVKFLGLFFCVGTLISKRKTKRKSPAIRLSDCRTYVLVFYWTYNTKEQAEEILDQLGIPFEMKLPANVPTTLGSLAKEQFEIEMSKGLSDIKAGRVHSAENIEEEMKRDFGI